MSKVKRKIVTDNLDRYKDTDKINWNSSCIHNKIIEFSYGDITGIFELISYDSKSKKVTFKYLENIYTIHTSSLLKCNLCNVISNKLNSKNKKEKSKKIYNGFTLYCHINKINNKRYFGITSQIPKYRWQNGNGYKNNKHFYNAIKKYGWNNFEHIILHDNLTEQDASSLERKYIEQYNTRNKICF